MSTLKQEKVVKILLENAGKSVGSAMLEAGYSLATAKNPQELTKSKGWSNLISLYLPDRELLATHIELLNAVKVIQIATYTNEETGEITPGFIKVPDWQIRVKALELAYKLKGLIK